MNNIKVCAYARFSSANQRVESIETQLDVIYKYCVKNDMTIVETFTDEAKTGTNDTREGFLNMIKQSKEKKWEAIVLYTLDRFCRNVTDHYYYKNLLENYGIRIISVIDGIEGPETAETGLMENIKIGLAEYYSAHLSKVILDSCIMKSKNKLKVGGIDNLGFTTINQVYTINEEEAKVVRFIFDLAYQGYNINEIVSILNEKGSKTKLGNDFSRGSVEFILRNRKYDAVMVYNMYKRKNKITSKNYKKIKKPLNEHVIIPEALPRIVNHKVFEAVQENLNNKRIYKRRYGNNSTYLLSNLIYCSNCGAKYHHEKCRGGRNRQIRYIYRCGKNKRANGECDGKSINAKYLNAYVLNLFDELFLCDNTEEHIIEKVMEIVKNKRNEYSLALKELQLKLENQNEEVDKLTIVAQQSNGVSKSSLMKAIQIKIDETLQTQIKINSMKKNIDIGHIEFIDNINDIVLEYEDARNEENTIITRKIIGRFLKQVNMSDTEIEVVFNLKEFTTNCKFDLLSIHRCPRDIIAWKKF